MADLVLSRSRELARIETAPAGFYPPDGALAFPLSQNWRASIETSFRPATAWLAATADAFHVWAALDDEHPRTEATASHTRLWELGDVFETFIQREGDEAYHEFHVSPLGHVLQLRFPRGDWPRHGDIEPYVRRETLINARAEIAPAENAWRVRAEIPFHALTGDATARSAWRICFARYDYDDRGTPCCSASAPFTQLDFHRRHEWTTISSPSTDSC